MKIKRMPEKIVALRKKKNWSQQDLADKIHVHVQTIGRWERGKALPSLEELADLAASFGLPADYLVFDKLSVENGGSLEDQDLQRLIKDLATLDEEHREMIKKFLTSFVFREKLSAEFSSNAPK